MSVETWPEGGGVAARFVAVAQRWVAGAGGRGRRGGGPGAGRAAAGARLRALLARGGVIARLIGGSATYPDRLFFLGGYDSFRGLFRDSLLPQDVADAAAGADDPRAAARLAVRGGDVFLNPRSELRILLWGPAETTRFVDAGNVWVGPQLIEPWRLRYAAGSGLRFATPVGPIAFDYGVNLARRHPGRASAPFTSASGSFEPPGAAAAAARALRPIAATTGPARAGRLGRPPARRPRRRASRRGGPGAAAP